MQKGDSTYSGTGHAEVLVLIYNNSILFPPTLNAIHFMAEQYQRVTLVEMVRKEAPAAKYPPNVEVHQIQHVPDNYWTRASVFLSFCQKIRQLLKQKKWAFVLLYDSSSALALRLAFPFVQQRPALWYHNHDVTDVKVLIKYTLNHFAYLAENWALTRVKLFSLPSQERRSYFDFSKLKGQYLFIPNYPALRVYNELNVTTPQNEIRLLYQGRVCEERGLEEIIGMLPMTINGKKVKLDIIGFEDEAFKIVLFNAIEKSGAHDDVTVYAPLAYELLPPFTSQRHIGLGIFLKQDVMNRTLGTATNKVYEYTACGMPFLYHDDPYFNEHYSHMSWALATDLSPASMAQCLSYIDNHYQQLSKEAKENFVQQRNFETVFAPGVQFMRSGKLHKPMVEVS